MPALVEWMNDEDWLVVTNTMHGLGDFGKLAMKAIPMIEEWLESPNEFLRVMAAITILKIDPHRTEFLTNIREAMNSDHPVVEEMAREFIQKSL